MGSVTGPPALERAAALITGGGQGIGACTARLLSERGCRVVIADVDAEAGEATASDTGAEFIQLDVSDPTSWDHIPPVDYAFLNAGTMTQAEPCRLEDLTGPAWSRVRGVNVDGNALGAVHLSREMARRGGGAILLAGSLAGLAAFPADPFYAATKAFTVALARSLGAMTADDGVRINALCPGEVATRMLPETRARLLSERGYRPLAAEEVARTAVGILEQPGSGEVWVLVSGAEPERWKFPDVPKPARHPA